MDSPTLVVLAGPTAVGKGTVVRALLQHHPQVVLSVSATTRAPRPGEVDGTHYHFLSPQAFDELIATGGMLEWALVHGRHKYGTPREPVERALNEGRPVLLEIDLAGARQVRKSFPDALFVFLAPPSWEELERRLIGRGTEDAAERERRLETAKTEMAAKDEFDVIVINDDLDQAVSKLAELMGLS
ncbi:guanylate kinase [Schaalia suimastitidis]|uniref:guanylate kinase n=1 Tax=Schaalia suimastitidis TaxID=121163 RepID=UPI00047E0770|nr:guanylate kinase [Schaalia suimastitidis]